MEKKLIFLIIFLSLKVCASSCTGAGMQFFPEQKEISLNSMFIIEGYARSQRQITDLNDKKIFLISENGDLIELKLLNILKGQKKLTQAIFKPEYELKPNTKYFIKNSDDSIGFYKKWNSDKNITEKVYWITNTSKTSNPIDPNIKIELDKTEFILYGCGPAANAIFNIKNNFSKEVWYKTEVMNLSNNETHLYYIKEFEGKLKVGHEMCAGAFSYDRSSDYKVRFTPMNIDGKATKTTSWFKFKNPYLNEK